MPTPTSTLAPPPRPRARPESSRLRSTWISPEDESRFIANYTRRTRVGMRPGLAAQGCLRAFFADGEMLGGYRVGHTAERYAALVDDRERRAWPFDPVDAAEVTHLWMASSLGASGRRTIYARMLVDLLATRQPYVMGGSVDPIVARQQMRMLPTLLHAGQTRALGGLRQLWLYFGTPASVVSGATASGVPVPWLALR